MSVIVAGPTGSGKSTLVNSLAGAPVAAAGALRPTTMSPLIVASSSSAPVLSEIAGVSCEVVFRDHPLLERMSLVDTPDIDSTLSSHRRAAESLIDCADAVVFVTSALRYADEAPWEVLRRALSRGAPVINVLNRVSSMTSGAIVDFRARLRAAGIDDDLVTVSEYHLTGESILPPVAVRSLAARLIDLVERDESERVRTWQRVFTSVLDRALRLADDLEDLAEERRRTMGVLSARAHARVERLDLSPIRRDLLDGAPPGPTRRSLRRWERRNRLPEAEIAELRSRSARRLAAIVETDMRTWLSSQVALEMSPSDRSRAMRHVGGLASAAADGWVEFVHRIARPIAPSSSWAVEAILIDAATSPAQSELALRAFGDETDELVERARRELMSRIEAAYDQVVELVCVPIGGSPAPGSLDRLRSITDGVAMVLADADA